MHVSGISNNPLRMIMEGGGLGDRINSQKGPLKDREGINPQIENYLIVKIF